MMPKLPVRPWCLTQTKSPPEISGRFTTLICDLPEPGLLSAKEIAALVGLAPHPKKSGKTLPGTDRA
jgi:hypothetical protein